MSLAVTPTLEAVEERAPAVDALSDTIVLLLLMTAVQRLVGFARGVLLCRWLDPHELGEWDLAFGFLLMAAPLAVLGLPGSFGRYVEYYRARGQMRWFVWHTAWITLALAAAAVALVACCGGWFSQLIFGRSDRQELVAVLAAGLAIVVLHNSQIELFTALRQFRVVSALQFVHSLLFACLGLGLVFYWRAEAISVVVAYAAACLLCVLGACRWIVSTWRELPRSTMHLAPQTLLQKLLPFAVWVWLTNWLSNLFDIADRYMIVHHSGLPAAEALVQVGNYHSSRLVPILLVTVAALLGNVALPHFSSDWESGRRQQVSQRVNLMLKLLGLAMLWGAVCILFAAPWLFTQILAGKYAGGLTVLPWTLTYCVWFGIIGVAQNYLWCAEKASWGSVAVLGGVLVNVVCNLLLLPLWGLQGAVIATAAANLFAYLTTLWFCHRRGLEFDPAVYALTLLPALLWLGPALNAVVLLGVSWACARGNWLLKPGEKAELHAVAERYFRRAKAFWSGQEAITDQPASHGNP